MGSKVVHTQAAEVTCGKLLSNIDDIEVEAAAKHNVDSHGIGEKIGSRLCSNGGGGITSQNTAAVRINREETGLVVDVTKESANASQMMQTLSGQVDLDRCSAKRDDHKRMFFDLNADKNAALDEAITSAGGQRIIISGFGEETTSKEALMSVKNCLREGRVIWLRGTIRRRHTANIKWMTQVCRTAHRAGVPWSLNIQISQPWKITELVMLR